MPFDNTTKCGEFSLDKTKDHNKTPHKFYFCVSVAPEREKDNIVPPFSGSFPSKHAVDKSYLDVKQCNCELWAISETRKRAKGWAPANPAATWAAQLWWKQ